MQETSKNFYIELSTNGTVYAWYTLDDGTKSSEASREISNIDTDKPSISYSSTESGIALKASGTTNATYEGKEYTDVKLTKSSSHGITVTASDKGFGIKEIIAVQDDDETNPTKYTGTSSVSLSETGRYTVAAVDVAGNITVEVFEIVDKPIITAMQYKKGSSDDYDVEDGAIVNNQTTSSRHIEVTYKSSGTSEFSVSTKNATQIITADKFIIDDSEEYVDGLTYTFTIKDEFNATYSLTFTVDRSTPDAPVISLNEYDPTNKDITVTVLYPTQNISDESRKYKIVNLATLNYDKKDENSYNTALESAFESATEQSYTEPFKVSENCVIRAYYSNLIGTMSSYAQETISNIDKDNPRIYINSKEDDVTIKDAASSASSIGITADDEEGSGIAKVSYELNDTGIVHPGNLTETVVSARGKYTITVVDKAGNENRQVFTLEEKPTIVTEPVVTEGQTITSSSVKFDVTGIESTLAISENDNTPVNRNTPYTYTVDRTGIAKLAATVTDKFGSKQTLSFVINQNKPAAPVFTAKPETYTSSSVAVSVTYPTGSTGRVYYIGDANTNTAELTADDWISYNGNITVTENNTRIFAKYEVYGEESAIGFYDVTNIDNKAPEITFASGEADVNVLEWDTAANEQKDGTDYFMTSASSVIVTASDNDGSGVASVRYRINGGEERTGLTTGQQISSEGVYEFKVTDNAGNVKVSTIEIVAKPVLTTSPTVSNGQITNKDITVTVTGTSAVIKINGKTPTEIDPSATNDTTYTIKETMNYSIVAEDVFGSKTSLVVISVDKDIPSAPVIAVDNEEPTNGTVDVIITYPSSAKENEKYYKIGLDGDVQRYNGPINLTENKTIYAWYVNTSENQSEQATYTVSNIDTVAPEIVFNTKDSAVSIADEDRAKVTTAKDVVMRVSDEGLGIDRIVYSLNNGSEIQASTETTTLSMRGT